MRLYIVILSLSAICWGCGWHRSVTFESPNRTERIEIFQPPIDPMLGLRIDYVQGQRRSTIFQAGETFISFAHVEWPKRGNSPIGVLVCGTRQVRLAYDPLSGGQRPFAEVRRALDTSARQMYGEDPRKRLPSDCGSNYYDYQFSRRYPDLPH